jgi:hypothetical protein
MQCNAAAANGIESELHCGIGAAAVVCAPPRQDAVYQGLSGRVHGRVRISHRLRRPVL